MKKWGLFLGAAALGVAFGTAAATGAWAGDLAKVDLAPDKVGTVADLMPISNFCGTKKIKVALADGWGGNYWRHITRGEFEDEASKCPNITETRYTDAEFNPQKYITDVQGLIAQHFDVIVTFVDSGPAGLKVLRQATEAGVAVVPYDTGEAKFGEIGKDYVDRVTERQVQVGRQLAEWMVKTLNGKGNVIVDGGTPGNPMTTAQAVGWHEVFAKNPGIKVLEGPVDTNWDPALAQKLTAAEIAKYGQIDGMLAETTGPIRAFQAAGKPIPAWGGQDLNDLSCLWADLHGSNPSFKMATLSSHTWMVRVALRKAVAAAEGINEPEPSLIDLPWSEDSTSSDPKLAVKCDKNMPMDSVPSSMLDKAKMAKLLAK